MNMEEDKRKAEQDDPEPLTDEEVEQLVKKDKRTFGIIAAIIDFFTGFFR